MSKPDDTAFPEDTPEPGELDESDMSDPSEFSGGVGAIAPSADFRCGFVAILGKPNAGKSTLLNRLVGEKIAIISPRPQTTRDRINGIVTTDRFQLIFVDLPGLVAPTTLLNTALVESIRQGLDGVDAALHLIDVGDRDPLGDGAAEILDGLKIPVVAAINKTDRRRGSFRLERWIKDHAASFDPSRYVEVVSVSALRGFGVAGLVQRLSALMPEGPPHFDPENLTDRDMRWLVAETVREKVFLLLGEEVPYSIATQTDEFQERPDGKWFIRVVIHVERESQKGIVIGAGGQTLKKIGQASRAEIERLVEQPVFLELWVKVRKNWTKSEAELRRFGYVSREGRKKKPSA